MHIVISSFSGILSGDVLWLENANKLENPVLISTLKHDGLTAVLGSQGGPGQRSQSSSMQQKTQGSKSSYGSSPYWGN